MYTNRGTYIIAVVSGRPSLIQLISGSTVHLLSFGRKSNFSKTLSICGCAHLLLHGCVTWLQNCSVRLNKVQGYTANNHQWLPIPLNHLNTEYAKYILLTIFKCNAIIVPRENRALFLLPPSLSKHYCHRWSLSPQSYFQMYIVTKIVVDRTLVVVHRFWLKGGNKAPWHAVAPAKLTKMVKEDFPRLLWLSCAAR